MEPILSFEHLTKTIPGDRSRLLFTGISGQALPGDSIAVLGASGQGKSTLLRVLARLSAADEGEIYWRGTPSVRIPGTQWRMKVGYVSQQAVMLPGSVEDNLQAVSRLHRSEFDSTLAHTWMRKIGLGQMDRSTPAAELSGGEKQRVALVRSLLLQPDVLLLDEATAALDETNKLAAEKLLHDWREERGTALIWVTHDREQARRAAGRFWTLAGGTLTESADVGGAG